MCTVQIEDAPWFVGKEIANTLGFQSDEISKRSERWFSEGEYLVLEKGRAQNESLRGLFGSRGGSLSLITESDLYKLVMRSDKPEAKEFQDWVTMEVLPAIRKDEGCIKNEEKVVFGSLVLMRVRTSIPVSST